MAKQLQLRKGSTADHSTFVGAVAELSVNTETGSLLLHDGVTAGGHAVAMAVPVANALAGKEDTSNKGVAGGYASLDATGLVPLSQLPAAATGGVASVVATAPLTYTGTTDVTISIPAATAIANGYMTSTYASKLDGIAANANNYVLPVASASLGGVKSGTDITVDASGNVSVNDNSHAHTIANVTGLQTALDGKVDDSQVLTNVPAGAVFTDTVYTHPTTDGNLHVPANGTTNSGKVLTAGATAGVYTWETPTPGVTDHTLLSNIGTNTHAQIDTHIGDATKHRVINDTSTTTTDLWSASKISTSLAGKSDTSHTHAGVYEPVFTKNTGFNKNFGTTAGTVSEGNHNHDATYSPLAHNHALDSLSNVTVTTNTVGEILKWDGAAWVNNTLAEAGISDTSHTHDYSATYLGINAKASDSNLLDGYDTGMSVTTANTIPVRDASGDIHARLFRSTYAEQTSAPATTADICFRNSTTDNYMRFMSSDAFINWCIAIGMPVGKVGVVFNGTTMSIKSSFGVSSLTDLGVGRYRVNFSITLPTSSYYISLAAGATDSADTYISKSVRAVTTTSMDFNLFNSGSTMVDDTHISVMLTI